MIELPELLFSSIVQIYNYMVIPSQKSGIYMIYNKEMELMYVGKAVNLRNRIAQHIQAKGAGEDSVYRHYEYFSFAVIEDPVDRDIYETYYINKLKPKLNKSKVFTYKSSYNDFIRNEDKIVNEAASIERRKRLNEILERIVLVV